jgi:hypothetical protein
MMPLDRLSTEPTPAAYKSPDSIDRPNKLTDYELGGIALQDPSAGLEYQKWTARADKITGDVFLRAEEVPEALLFTAPGVTDLSLAFDQNMRPFIAYVQNGRAKYRWYNTVLGANEIVELDVADRTPKCCMDDKRPWPVGQGDNDIILAYLRDGALYYRQQRDRFEVERLLKVDAGTRLIKVGMNVDRRLQFELE